VTDGWVRATATNPNNSGFFGSVPLILVQPGQTVLRSWWNLGLYYLDSDVDQYPPGNSILRAGVVYAEEGLMPLATPTPISNADADWLAITSVNPYGVQLSRAVNVAWQLNWGFPIDLSIKSQRRNDTEDDMTLYLAWEMSLDDEVSGFTMNGWWASMDSLIRTPD
jgi:hypothetical protein